MREGRSSLESQIGGRRSVVIEMLGSSCLSNERMSGERSKQNWITTVTESRQVISEVRNDCEEKVLAMEILGTTGI